MRFNQLTCVDFLETGVPGTISLFRRDWPEARKQAFKQEVIKSFEPFRPYFQQKVQYLTKPFHDAYRQNHDKVTEALKAESLGTVSGTFVLSCAMGIVKTIFYYIEDTREEGGAMKSFNCHYLEFTRSRYDDITSLAAAINYNSEQGVMDHYIADQYQSSNIGSEALIAEYIKLCGFLKYCEVQTKILKPKEKYRNTGVKYFNETKSNIEILDSLWFTTIIRTEGFGVRGHLRLQPYGPGMAKKKWIYIAPFEKDGYSRKAKVLTNQSENI